MSAAPLASLELAEKMTFPELARNIRDNIEQAKQTRSYAPDPVLLTKLVDALEQKIAPPELPQAPVAPAVPLQISLHTDKGRENWESYKERRALYARDYAHDLEIYNRQADLIRPAIAEWHNKYGASEHSSARLKIAERLRADVDAFARGDFQTPIGKLWWRFLPAGQSDASALVAEIRALKQRDPHLRYDEERILYAQTLSPSHIFVGEDDFDGYFAFVFEHTNHVLLENPQEGNAAYVFKQHWMELSKLSKRDLLEQYRDLVQRVPHRNTGNWKWYIRQALRSI